MKLKEVTFTLGAKPMRELLWCNTVPKGKRKLLEVCIDEERAYHSIALWSDTYPHATVDYIYKDTN